MYTSPTHDGNQELILCKSYGDSHRCCVFMIVIALLVQKPVFGSHAPKT